MARAENQKTSIAPSRPPTNTSGFEMSTAASGEPSAATHRRGDPREVVRRRSREGSRRDGLAGTVRIFRVVRGDIDDRNRRRVAVAAAGGEVPPGIGVGGGVEEPVRTADEP